MRRRRGPDAADDGDRRRRQAPKTRSERDFFCFSGFFVKRTLFSRLARVFSVRPPVIDELKMGEDALYFAAFVMGYFLTLCVILQLLYLVAWCLYWVDRQRQSQTISSLEV